MCSQLDHVHSVRTQRVYACTRRTYDTYVYIYIREIVPFNSLVWGSLTLAPITLKNVVFVQYSCGMLVKFTQVSAPPNILVYYRELAWDSCSNRILQKQHFSFCSGTAQKLQSLIH